MSNYSIIRVNSDDEYQIVALLFRAYQKELGKDLSFQNFENELNHLPDIYTHSNGILLLLKELDQNKYVGCVGLKRIKESVCELKRLYVDPKFRAKKYGKHLLESAISVASDLNYEEVWLDTLKELKPAVRLYEHFGFIETEPYYENPYEDVLFMKKRLS